MKQELTEEQHKELRGILSDPVRSAELSNRAIDVWILQETGKKPARYSRGSKKHSSVESFMRTG